jgi:hypothetical protein
MMAIEDENIGKNDTIRTLQPYDFHRVQIVSGSLVIACEILGKMDFQGTV